MKRPSVLLLCVLLAFAAGLGAGRATGQGKPRMWADVALEITTDEIPRRTHVRANLDHWEPGAETGKHVHPGPTVFVMLDGEVEETLADGRTRTIKAGQAFWKPPRQEHNVRNRSDKPARALAVHLDPAK
ncbi:MAG: cupin domain-containing protein [Candidatus Rokubacteria bacterium]|nr:cupin domain-containing protein [Candidatus Rokubacteria bacterium]